MHDVRYVCLSDLHLGAENSILTGLDPRTLQVNVHTPSRALTGLLDCLKAVVESNESSQKPTLILAGDIVELALATESEAAMVLEMFVERALGPDGIFDDTVYFVAGNHDHHLWEGAREKQYSDYVRSCPRGHVLGVPWHTTRMRAVIDPDPVYSELLTTLVHRTLGRHTPVCVRIVYPNMALDAPTSNRHVFIHHGHFIETMYTAMSALKDMLFPEQRIPWTNVKVWDWESENFAWIDFFWSTLGRSGAVGSSVGLIYASLQSPQALRPLERNLMRGLASMLPWPPWLQERGASAMARGLDQIAKRAMRLERSQKGAVLSAAARDGLQVYVEYPLRHQVKTEYEGRVPDDVTIVFGHTHKPFEAVRRFTGYPRDVCLYNTGGWVVDSTETRPLYGAAAILFDEDLNSACLRFYNQSSAASAYRVGVARCGEPNPFFEKLVGLVDPAADPWNSFSRAAAELVEQRHDYIRTIVTQTSR